MILKSIAVETGISQLEIAKIVRSANHLYKTYEIPKRTKGYRTIDHPSPELKFLQRWLNRNIFVNLQIHDRAFAYRLGIGIAENARAHANSNYLLKVDFLDFFHCIKGEDVKSVLEKNRGSQPLKLNQDDMEIIVQVVCKDGALTIGAPSSPVLSNAVLFEFDQFLSESCKDLDITYTRYADDLFMSTNAPNRLEKILQTIRKDLKRRTSPLLKINEDKTVFTSRKRRRIATGITLTSRGRLSIGREKKRLIRSMIFRYSAGQLSKEEVSYLRGYLAYIRSVEPEFLVRMQKKFGETYIDRLMREQLKARKSLSQ